MYKTVLTLILYATLLEGVVFAQTLPKEKSIPIVKKTRSIYELVPRSATPNMFATFHDFSPSEKRRRVELIKRFSVAKELLQKGEIAQAKAIYESLRGNEDAIFIPRAIDGLCDVARLSGDKASEIRYYEQLIFEKPGQTWSTSRANDRDVRMKYALLLQSAGRYDEAWEHYQYAMNVQGGWRLPKPPAITREQVPSAQFVFAANLVVTATLLDFDNVQAATFARAAAKANPVSGLPYYYLGQTLWRTDLAGAKAAYEKAMLYGHGEIREKAKRELAYVSSELAKPQVVKRMPASGVPTP